MPEEEKKEKAEEKASSDKAKEGEKKPEPDKNDSQAKSESSKSSDDKTKSKDKPDSTDKTGDDKTKDAKDDSSKQKTEATKADNKTGDKTKEPAKSGSKQAIKTSSSGAKSSSSEQKSRKPSISVSGTESGTEDLVKSAMQKARRASIRAKGRGSSVSQSLLAQKTSRLISTVDISATLEADNIWDLAVKMKQVNAELDDPDEGQRETTLIVLGGKQSGKTTLIGQLLDSEEAARRTLGLDYTYARRAGKGIGKDVCQIWELGGGTSFLQLLDTPVRADRLSDTACVIVVDLTQPETILPTVEATTKYLSELIDKKLKEAGTTGVLVRNLLNSQLNVRRPPDHPDTKSVKPLLIPLALVGGMYDKLQPMDTTEKKVVAEAMRWAAHKHFATLLYFSSKEVALQSRAKDLLTHMAFGEEANPRQSLEVSKPLQIAAGEDSFRAIGGGGDGSLPYEVVLSHVSEKWPPRPEAAGVPDDPSRDATFAEPDVDGLRAEKVKELDRLRQDLERRRKMALERAAAEKAKSKAPAAVSKQAAQQAAAEFLERHHSSVGETAKKGDTKKTDAKAESKPGAKSDGKDSKPAAKPAPKEDAKHDSKQDAKPAAKPAAKTEAKEDAKPAAKTEDKKETKPDAKSDAKADSKSDGKSDGKSDSKSDGKSDGKAETKPAAKSDAKSDSKPEAKHDAKPAAKTEAKAEAKPAAKAEHKADAKPAAKK